MNDRSASNFVPGQRWISETQPELGLGLVESVEHRRVRIQFPATGEERTYATATAPLWRALFGAGERIRDGAGREMLVTAAEESEGLVTYLGEAVEDGAACSLQETALDAHLRTNRPRQKLLSARFDRDTWFGLRLATWRARAQAASSTVRGLVGARVSPIAHQLWIAAEVADRHAPRVLLADEVGLGKTIEAGLILHRMLLAGRVARVLILVPESLLHQWLVELLRRFNLSVTLFDPERIADALAGDGGPTGNPFLDEQQVLCSLDVLTSTPAAARAALGGAWDLLIIDEAHHLRWTPEESSLEYDLVAALAAETPAVLLLTATPEQLGRAGHFARLRLLDPHRFSDFTAFLAEEADYAPVAELAGRLMDGTDLTPTQQSLLDRLLGETTRGDMAEVSPDQLVARLLDRHGTGRVLFRNTRAAIPGFPERRVHPAPLQVPDAYREAATASPWPERLHGPGWTDLDPRVDWLIETLRRLQPEKILLITAAAETVIDLRQALQRRSGIHAAVFHEGMEIVERDRAAAYFADPEEGSRILLCSEIGSEGRNFQFAHHLVLFDLPLDAELLEQRIGRLDRIGQTRAIDIHVPYLASTPADTLFRWYTDGLDALGAASSAASAVQARLGGRLLGLLDATAPDPASVETLIAEAADLRSRLEAELAVGRDRLLEQGSHRPEAAARLVDAMEAQDRDPGLMRYLAAYWDAFGVDHEPGPGGSLVLHPGAHMREERFPGLPEDGLTASLERRHALAHEDHAFLTWEHPMVRAAMDLLTGSDLGSSALVLTRAPGFTAGELLLDALFVAECPAPTGLGAHRYLAPLALRLLVDTQGRDRAGETDPESLQRKCLGGNRKLARALIAAKAEAITTMADAAEVLAQQAAEPVRTEAMGRMAAEIGEEIERLSALARVNPTVRPEEIERLQRERELLVQALGRSRLRLDALRLIVFA
jgi:ATP-dependent helicase HepA